MSDNLMPKWTPTQETALALLRGMGADGVAVAEAFARGHRHHVATRLADMFTEHSFIQHPVWEAAIRAVAIEVLVLRGVKRAFGPDAEDEWEQAIDGIVDQWQKESLPCEHVVRYFLDSEVWEWAKGEEGWTSRLWLAIGDACTTDARERAAEAMAICRGDPFVGEAVTEESVNEFFNWWRQRFLERVAMEAAAIEVAHAARRTGRPAEAEGGSPA